MKVYLTDGRRVNPYRYAIVGRRNSRPPSGQMETVHVKKVQEGDDKRAFDVWLATE